MSFCDQTVIHVLLYQDQTEDKPHLHKQDVMAAGQISEFATCQT